MHRPAELSVTARRRSLAAQGRVALLDRICPAEKLITLANRDRWSGGEEGQIARGGGVGHGQVDRGASGRSAGMPHWPARAKVRVAPAWSAGPPAGPCGLRVSISRQGVML